MIKLIIFELKKIFHRKSIYIIWLLLLVFCLANNILYKLDYDDEGYYINDYQKNTTSEIKKLENDLSKYDKNNSNDVTMYVSIKTKIDLLKLKDNYDVMSWQYNKIDYLEEDVYNINYYKYVSLDSSEFEKSQKMYEEKLDKFNSNDWEYFARQEKQELVSEIDILKDKLETMDDKLEIENINKKIKDYEQQVYILNIRLDKNIDYGTNYLNDALVNYTEGVDTLAGYENIDKLNHKELIEYNNIKATTYINKYIVDNGENQNKQNNLNYQLRTIVEDYELFIIIIILLISGSIVSEEFNKGTIKLLLLKPYSRSKILLSKYLSSIIIMFLTILFAVFLEVIIGGYLFGFDSLSMKVAVWDLDINGVVCYNIFEYMLIRILYNLPFLIMILTISFCIGVISLNTSLSVAVTILIYTFSEFINDLIINNNVKILAPFITLNWNFLCYMFGGSNEFEYLNLKSSIVIYIIYLAMLLTIAFGSFKRNNIKNI